MPFFTKAPAARSDSTGTTGSMKVTASTIRKRVAEVTAAPGDRGVGQEELVQLALELGRQVARGAAQPYLLGDLRHDLLHVGLGVCRQRHLGVAHGASLAQRFCANAAEESMSLSVEMSAACTFIRSEPVTLPGFMTSKVPAFSIQS